MIGAALERMLVLGEKPAHSVRDAAEPVDRASVALGLAEPKVGVNRLSERLGGCGSR